MVVGHRGAAGLEPENTLRSVRKAIELGVDQVEIDVRVTKDGHLVIMHDETVDRTTNGHGYVRDLTFDEIRGLDAGKGERVPTLDEVLNLTQGVVKLQVELKVPEALKPSLEVIERRGAEDDVLIISFIHDLLREAKRLKPNIETGALFSKVPEDICERAIDVGAGSILVYYRSLNSEVVKKAHKLGLTVAAWNPNTIEDMKYTINLGVDIIGSDRPDILINLLKSMGLR